MAKTKYSWVPFYEELADKLLTFKSNRSELIEKVKEAHQMMGLNLPKIEKDNDNILTLIHLPLLPCSTVANRAWLLVRRFVRAIRMSLA